MQVVSYSHLRKNMKSFMDKICDNHEALIVTRKENNNLVILSMEDYNSLTETNYLLSSKANAKHLERSFRQIEKGETVTVTLDQLN